MDPNAIVMQIRVSRQFFDTATRCLEEDDSTFAPTPDAYTAAQQVAHVAQVIDWFIEGAFRPEGFSTDWDAMVAPVRAVTSLEVARKWLDEATERAAAVIGAKSSAELSELLPEQGIMDGQPRGAIAGAIADHTAHHRGALAVYARLRGKVPEMPYG